MTEGPWYHTDSAGGIITGLGDVVVDEVEHDEDAAGIVALRNAAPALLDEVERLRKANFDTQQESNKLAAELEDAEADLAEMRDENKRLRVALDNAEWAAKEQR
jgi:uncharacterized protein (DUF1786 family)